MRSIYGEPPHRRPPTCRPAFLLVRSASHLQMATKQTSQHAVHGFKRLNFCLVLNACQNWGIAPRTIRMLLEAGDGASISASFFEMSTTRVKDLLNNKAEAEASITHSDGGKVMPSQIPALSHLYHDDSDNRICNQPQQQQ